MTYCCDFCGFLFSRRGEIWECPSCRRLCIRPATEEEKDELEKQLRNSEYWEEYVR